MSTIYFKFYVNLYKFGQLVQIQPMTEYLCLVNPAFCKESKTKRAFAVTDALFAK